MGSNKKAILILTAILLSSSFNFPLTTFAEGDTVCSGRITGTTRDYAAGVGTNINAGKITFDAHPGSGAEDNKAIDYSGNIYHTSDTGAVTAPANRGDAGCTNKEAGTFDGKAYEYALKGWAWDSNGGFVSLNCKNKVNNAGGADVPCGDFDYGVYVGAADPVTKVRNLSGYAWNPTFGYISMSGNGAFAGVGGFTYGVTIDANGKSSGFAWTSAGIYLDFTGLTFYVDKAPVVAAAAWCKNKPYVCVEVTPDPTSLSFNGTSDVKVADGKQGYDVHVYFGDKDGNPINPALIKNLGDITFNWKDSVRMNQVDPLNVTYNAVPYKPLTFNLNDFQLAGDHYTTKNKITSYAPTSESKLSLTTSTKPAYLVNNEKFIDNPDGLTLPKADDNKLILENVTYPNLVDKIDANKVIIPATSSPIFPNGKVNMPIKFRPAIYAELYANDKQDSILAYRSLPTVVNRGLKSVGDLNANLDDGSAEFHVGYSSAQTKAQNGCADVAFDFTVTDNLPGSTPKKVSPAPAPLDIKASSSISALLNKTFDLSITPEIPTDLTGELPCKVASGASVYSIIKYTVDGKPVSYFDNKLRRIGASLTFNPAVVVHGNILAQSTSAVQEGQPVLAVGSVNVDVVHDTIDENLRKYGGNGIGPLNKGTCTLLSFGDSKTGYGPGQGCTAGIYTFDVGNEHVLYTKGSDITLSILGPNSWDGKWVIVSDGGNIFVDKNLHPSNTDTSKISLIAFRSAVPADYYKTGNIYIHPDVTNIMATIVAGGSVFSYDGNHANIDATNGEPIWADYSAMIEALKSQLFIQGAMSSSNTIGGANADQGKYPQPHLLAGGGRVIPLPASLADRMKAQYYDLNYLRMFKLNLMLSPEGLPVDQKCGKGLTPDDQANLIAGKTVCGEKKTIDEKTCDINGTKDQATACDGINPLLIYDAQNTTGDLITPSDFIKAEGLKDNDFNPVYVYAVAPDTKSFIFSSPRATNTSGK